MSMRLFQLLTAAGAVACSGAVDPSPPGPHSSFVAVRPGVRIEALDYGGNGEPLVLLAGAGNTAHVFEGFAGALTDRFHVVGLTRRGFGASSQPEAGYDTATLTGDLRIALDSLGFRRVTLIGHSVAGDEMTQFAIDHPERVSRLVYLDAAYDRAALSKLQADLHLPDPPGPAEADVMALAAFANYLLRVLALPLPEAEIRAITVFARDGSVEGLVTPPQITAALVAGVVVPDYRRLTAPALSIYAVPLVPSDLVPWITPTSPDWPRVQVAFDSVIAPLYREQRAKFAADVKGG